MESMELMWKVRGVDGRDYGPADSQTIKRWISEGRIRAETMILNLSTGEWARAGAIPEFASLFGIAQSNEPPVIPTQKEEVKIAVAPREVSGLSVASFILGLFGWLPFASILAIIFGAISLGQISASNGKLGGRGFALAGLILGLIWSVTLTLSALLFMTRGYLWYRFY